MLANRKRLFLSIGAGPAGVPAAYRRAPLRRSIVLATTIVLGALLLPSFLSACPGCKEAAGDAGNGGLARGFAASIYVMLGGLFTLVGAIVVLAVRASRRIEALRAESEPRS